MGVVQLSLFFLLAVHHNRLLQIHSYYNPIWFFSFLESVIRSQGQWRFWSISADSLEKGLQCSPGQAQPRVHWAVTLHPGILHRRSKCLPFLPTPPGDPHQAVTQSLLCSLIQWMFTEHLLIDWKKKKKHSLKVEHMSYLADILKTSSLGHSVSENTDKFLR